MTDPFDRDLARLARSVTPEALDNLERRVAATIAAGPPAGMGFGPSMALAGGVALMLGVAGGGIMAERSGASQPPPLVVAALDGGLAPSTLLLGR